jgi:hypothetical protein
MASRPAVLLIACGALAREITALKRLGGWDHVTVRCLPAELHNRPEEIPEAVAKLLEKARDEFAEIVVAYADCGTGGRLDAVLAEYGARRLPGAHCYEVFAGAEGFVSLQEEELGTFYLTDFLVRHFDRLVIRGLGLDRHPELQPLYFGNYRRVVHLAQSRSPEMEIRARTCAKRLGLEFEQRVTGMGALEQALAVDSLPAATSGEAQCTS